MKSKNLVISCLDQPGIVRVVSDFLYDLGANITYLEQHIEDERFFMRVEWDFMTDELGEEDFLEKFEPLKFAYEMTTKVNFNERKLRLGIFCSRELHCLIDLLAKVELSELDIEIAFVLSNFKEAEEITSKFSLPFYHVSSKLEACEAKQLEIIKDQDVDFIALARYMKVLSADFIRQIGSEAIINVHHSFLPSFVGAKPYDEAYERGVKLIGATAHFVIPELDQGPIIEQGVKRVGHAYDVSSLKVLGRGLEKQVFSYAIKKCAENKLIIYNNRVIVFA
jgi:formyltetrahydrofolate deformylase